MRRFLLCWLVSLAVLAAFSRAARAEPPKAPSAAAAQPPAQPRAPSAAPEKQKLDKAKRHFERALEQYAKGHYRRAIVELRRAHALDPKGKDLIYNLAVVHEKLGEVGPALSYYRQVLELERDKTEKERIAATVRRLEGARDELIRARLDEARVVPEKRAAGARDSTHDTLMLASAGVAAVAIVVGSILGARALSQEPGPQSATGGDRDVSDVRADARRAHRSAVAADVSFLVGLVSGGLAGVLYFGQRPNPDCDSLHTIDSGSQARSTRVGLDLGMRF